VGGRGGGQLIYRVEWLDQFVENEAQPVMATPVRRRA
jgi:hypothetical protein